MANQEHLDILKQGVRVWNQWRETQQYLNEIDLEGTNFHKSELRGVNLSNADLRGADFSGADLTWANLNKSDFSEADLSEASLTLSALMEANLTAANLHKAELTLANLRGIILVNANLRNSKLDRTNLINADLRGADFTDAQIGNTAFDNVNLNGVKGLDTIYHFFPSSIGIDTIVHSQGKIPEIFLRNAGVPASIIEAIPSLIGSLKPIDFFSCFISYSSKDQGFAERLHADLQSKGVGCWYAPEDMKIGDKIRPRIDEAILIHDKLLLVLSEHSVENSWVEKEVETAFEKERQQNKTVLFPICLDDCVMHTDQAWAADIRRTRHIGDFKRWKSYDDYQKALSRLLRDLKLNRNRSITGYTIADDVRFSL